MSGLERSSRHVEGVLETLKQRAAEHFPGAHYASVYSDTEKRMVIVPIHEAIDSQFSHGVDYGSGVFEGGSALINERTGIPHIILHEARMNRLFHRSLPNRGYQSPVSQAALSEAARELIALQGESLFLHPDGVTPGFVRAYLRPTIHPAGLGGFGVSMKKDHPIGAGILAWSWPDYLDPSLAINGGVAAITGHQRLFPITGKHASNYGAAVKDGNLARSLGTDELIYLAPYLIDKDGHEYWTDPSNTEAKLRDGVLSDGPGEECVAITKDQQTLVYTPMRTNRLGGTTLQYIIDHVAEKIGLQTQERDITLNDIRADKYSALAMIGNAVKVTPMREIRLYNGESAEEVLELFPEKEIPGMLQTLMDRWDEETRGLIDPSHPSLLTLVK